ncbi:MAG: DegT/DnrJ/EryC1/StrS family aminotransferase [Acidobacteria bacterium]|nr:DegT/DnrJ/EryC1/StrS family aminotransferase [Acidobacteriota bacterium]
MATLTKVPFVDLKAQRDSIQAEVDAAVLNVFDKGDFILGAAVEKFEADYAAYIGAKHAIGVGTGLAAIEIALRAYGVGPGDEVITAANTFIATVLAITAVGATPVFVDMDGERYTIDPAAISAAITPKTRAIVPVHLYGQTADLDGVLAVARRHNLLVIEDAAQAHGAKYRGTRVGTFGHAAAFSFYPAKNLGAYGDGGMITTNDDAAAAKMRLLGNYGQRVKYYHSITGTNSRLDTAQAAVLGVKLPRLDGWNAARRRHASAYSGRLKNIVHTPAPAADAEHIFHLYVIETERRDARREALKQRGVDTGIHYPVPAHLQECVAYLGYKLGTFPVTEAAAGRILSLPMYAELSDAQIDYVCDAVADVLK